METQLLPLVLDLSEELHSRFGVPLGTPLKKVPWQFVRHVVENTFKPAINIYVGNKKVPFYVNDVDFQKYYNAFEMPPEQLHWIDPRYRFFGGFYQEGDDSLDGYLTGLAQNQQQRTEIEVEGITNLLKLGPESSICDCPCGVGRHSIELAKRGHRVLAVDLNYEQLKAGVLAAQKDPGICSLDDRHVIFVLENMLGLGQYLRAKHDVMDAVVNMFYSFGFFEKEEDNEKVAKNFFDLLKPGGKFLMHTDVNMATIKSGKYKFYESRTLQSGQNLRIIDRYNPVTKRIDGSWIIGDQRKDYSVRVYENQEFVDLCRKVGFRDVKIYSNWEGSPYNENSEMVIFVAEK